MYKFIILALALLGIDQGTKALIVSRLNLGDQIEVIPNFLYITSIRNRGAAWGILEDHMSIFYVITTVVVLAIVFAFYKYKKEHFTLHLSLSLILAGAVGNLVDRIRYQEVVDFIQTIWGNYYFPIFNVADMCLSIGVVVLMVYVLFGDKWNKKKSKQRGKYYFE
ncbi:signal peptidase II [Brochothrix campestris]|uniref:Lipoprotein signal peptidase n=1 Tax=Brochothrix campestris FSL F6-1037 TaxID=1265861 RepID=W7CL91_9LIST|nr:signal peptidase II [Brochothrix campestris]EUJ37345.1 lipoprotein signal peptidase [Brochothrix campestris FSL F6-1037]